MSHIGIVCRKEILDNLRDRRTMFSTLLFGPIFAPAMFAVMIQIVVDRAQSSMESAVSVPAINIQAAPNLRGFLESQRIRFKDGHGLVDLASAEEAVRSGQEELVLVLEESFAEVFSSGQAARVTLVFDRSRSRDSAALDTLNRVLRGYSEQIGRLRLLARGIDPNVTRPMIVDSRDVSTPTSRSALLLGVLTYFLLFATLMGGMYLAIDTTTGERERKSLEPLLALPVTRTSLLVGKIGATVTFMLLSLGLSLVGFSIALNLVSLEQLGMTSGFTAGTAAAAFFVLLPFSLLGAVLMTLVASFTKSYREAQTYLGLLMIVPTLPVAFATITNVEASQALMWVPGMSQHLLITVLIKQEPVEIVMLLQSVASTLLYTFVLGLIAARLYKREALLG